MKTDSIGGNKIIPKKAYSTNAVTAHGHMSHNMSEYHYSWTLAGVNVDFVPMFLSDPYITVGGYGHITSNRHKSPHFVQKFTILFVHNEHLRQW